MIIDKEWIEQARARSEFAASVTLPIDQFKALLRLAEQVLEAQSSGKPA